MGACMVESALVLDLIAKGLVGIVLLVMVVTLVIGVVIFIRENFR